MDGRISRRTLLGSAALGSALSAQQQTPRSKPNVIVILFDDLGCTDLGYLGATDLKTPNIDHLAAGGAVCRNWYSNAPVCAPARSALMTGRHPIRCGLARNGDPLQPSEETIASVLKRDGYETALTGK